MTTNTVVRYAAFRLLLLLYGGQVCCFWVVVVFLPEFGLSLTLGKFSDIGIYLIICLRPWTSSIGA